MLVIQSKLIDFKTKKCVGVVCINGATSVALSLEKAKELEVQDIDIIEYLSADIEEVAVHPRRKNYFALLSNSTGFLEDFDDVAYDKIGDTFDLLNLNEVIWGYLFRAVDFIELDNSIAIRRALADAEVDVKEN